MARLKESGIPMIITQALYAIVGAVALQKGGEAANNVVRDKILTPLGVWRALRSCVYTWKICIAVVHMSAKVHICIDLQSEIALFHRQKPPASD